MALCLHCWFGVKRGECRSPVAQFLCNCASSLIFQVHLNLNFCGHFVKTKEEVWGQIHKTYYSFFKGQQLTCKLFNSFCQTVYELIISMLLDISLHTGCRHHWLLLVSVNWFVFCFLYWISVSHLRCIIHPREQKIWIYICQNTHSWSISVQAFADVLTKMFTLTVTLCCWSHLTEINTENAQTQNKYFTAYKIMGLDV